MGFLTFLVSYFVLAMVRRGTRILLPNREPMWLRPMLTVAIFVLLFGMLAAT